jgi:hypothetical protein
LGSFGIWGSGATISAPFTCPTKISNGRCLRYVVFECHIIFWMNWESFAHTYQQKKTCLGYVVPKLQGWQISSFGWWTNCITKSREHILIFELI